jgi:predicted phosphate transport protein (TIGR00153 family)
MLKRFLPKQNKFFDILIEMADNMQEAARLLKEMFEKHESYSEYSSRIHILENKCDDLTHSVIGELNDTFITPIDREDIYSLVNSLDDIVDSIDTIGSRATIYKLKVQIPFSVQLCEILYLQAKVIAEVIKQIQDPKLTTEKIVQVKHLETEGDIMFRDALEHLFEHEKDAINLIKEKELIENIERAIDRCHHTATVVEGILIKNM